MKKDLIFGVFGIIFGIIITTSTNSSGKYQVVEIIHPEKLMHQTYLLNTRTGQIQQLVYGLSGNMYWAPAEAVSEKEYDKRYTK
jgi:hypothetical protein